MGFVAWLKDPGLRGELLWIAVSSDDPEESAEALTLMREQGWLADSSMRGVDLHDANLQGADFSKADLEDADFRGANLAGANFSGARLRWAIFDNADLTGADFQEADLRNASIARAKLENANLQDADLGGADVHHSELVDVNVTGALLDEADLGGTRLTEPQLLSASTLSEANLPDGKPYDGRYNLSGDLDDAVALGLNLDDPEDMAVFYSVPVERYQAGQEWASKNKRARKPAKKKPSTAKTPDLSDEAEDDLAEIPYGSGPVSFLDIMAWPFKDRESLNEYLDDDEHEENLRRMAAWLSAFLVWLPAIVISVQRLLVVMLRPKVGYMVSTINETAMIISVALLSLAGISLTVWALQARGRHGTIARSLAIFFAILCGGGTIASAPVVAIGYVTGLLLAYIYLGRNARITLYWVGAILIIPSISLLLRGGVQIMGAIDLGMPVLIALTLLVIVLGFVAISLLRYWVRTSLLHQVGRRRDSSIIGELQIGYLVSAVLMIWSVITDFSAALSAG